MGDREASHRVQVQLVGLGVVEPPFLVPLLWPPSMSALERFRLAASAPLLLAGYALGAAKLDAGARPLLPAFPPFPLAGQALLAADLYTNLRLLQASACSSRSS